MATRATPKSNKEELASRVRKYFADISYCTEHELEAACFGLTTQAYRKASIPDEKRQRAHSAISTAIQDKTLSAEHLDGNAAGATWRIEAVSATIWAFKQFPNFPDYIPSFYIQDLWNMDEEERRAKGRYTLPEAAHQLAEKTGEAADGLLKDLEQAAISGQLIVKRPGSEREYQEAVRYRVYGEAYGDDLNKWLGASHLKRLAYRFPSPEDATAALTCQSTGAAARQAPTDTRRTQKSLANDKQEVIFEAIEACGHAPQQLPKARNGLPGIRAKVWHSLMTNHKTEPFNGDRNIFHNTWAAMRNAGLLTDRRD